LIQYIRWLLGGIREARHRSDSNDLVSDGPERRNGTERAFTVHLTVADREALFDPLMQRFDALDQRIGTLAHVYDTLQQSREETSHSIRDLRESVEALQKQISRSGKEQFKTNSLTEKNLEQLSEALRLLRDADERREAEMLALHEQSRKAQKTARQEVVQSLLPVLDSLDEAIRSGRQVLRRLEQVEALPEAEAPARPPGPVAEERDREPQPSGLSFLDRLFGRKGGWLADRDSERDAAAAGEARDSRTSQPGANGSTRLSPDLRQGMEAWVEGLTFVVQRLLNLLAAEGVRPIEAEGQPFDPQVHMAMDTVPASEVVADGVVAVELRRGYLTDGRVLRHAEVIVARAAPPPRERDFEATGSDEEAVQTPSGVTERAEARIEPMEPMEPVETNAETASFGKGK
jgi:molecular chaperone GrpE (heat shock protein)